MSICRYIRGGKIEIILDTTLGITETGIKEYRLCIEDNREITFLTMNNENRNLISIDNDGNGGGFIHLWLKMKIVVISLHFMNNLRLYSKRKCDNIYVK